MREEGKPVPEDSEKKEIKINRWVDFLRWTAVMFFFFGLLFLVVGFLGVNGLFGKARPDTSKTLLKTSLVMLPIGGLALLAVRQHGEKLFPEWFRKEMRHHRKAPEPGDELTETERRRSRAGCFGGFRAVSFACITIAVCFSLWPAEGDEYLMGPFVVGFFLTAILLTFPVERLLRGRGPEEIPPVKYILPVVTLIIGAIAFWLWVGDVCFEKSVTGVTRAFLALTFISAAATAMEWLSTLLRDRKPPRNKTPRGEE